MADDTEKKTPEEETAPPAPEEEPTSDAGATEAQDAATAADDATASEAETSSEDAPAEPEATAEPEASEGESAEALSPKQRRQRERTAKFAEQATRPQRTPEERQAERDAGRRRKAQVRSAYRTRAREKAKAKRDGAAAGPLPTRREKHPGRQKTRQGLVVSDGASKTIVVRINVTRRHPFYEKVIRTTTTLHAHDEREDAHVGDTVVVRESRPLSRTKRWRLVDVLERAK
jgi:small subunit ribosomal protein S17